MHSEPTTVLGAGAARPTLLVLGAGILQVPAIERAQRLGLRVAAADRDPAAPGALVADECARISTHDLRGLLAYGKELRRRTDLRGVYTAGAECATSVAQVAQWLDLPHTPPSAAYRCDRKVLARRLLELGGITGPRFTDVKRLGAQTFGRVVAAVGLPFVVKAADNCGSRGLRVVREAADFASAVRVARRWSRERDGVLVEECLHGSEHSLDAVVYHGQVYAAGMCDRDFDPAQPGLEIGHSNPSELPVSMQTECFRLAGEAAKAVGIDFGVVKLDLMLTGRYGPVILEMTNRLSGGFDSQYTKPYATGIDALGATIELAIGQPLDARKLQPKWHQVSVCRAAFPAPGRVVAIRGLAAAQAVPRVRQVFVLVREGDVIEPYAHCAQRPVFVVTVADTREEASAAAAAALARVEVLTES